MRNIHTIVLATFTVLVVFVSAGSSCAPSGDVVVDAKCNSDLECKGDRICVSGKCVNPGTGGASASATTPASSTGSGGACAGSEVLCDDSCVDLNEDPKHCGNCVHACPSNHVCKAGSCIECAPTGEEVCGNACVKTLVDPGNCGGCGKACSANFICNGGNCVDCNCMGCDPAIACGNTCVNPNSNKDNCGGCGIKCGDYETCWDSKCACEPGSQTTLCDGKCIHTNTGDNCGGCNQKCGTGAWCNGSSCYCPIDTKTQPYGMCNGKDCISLADNNNCDACGNVCPAGKSCFYDNTYGGHLCK